MSLRVTQPLFYDSYRRNRQHRVVHPGRRGHQRHRGRRHDPRVRTERWTTAPVIVRVVAGAARPRRSAGETLGIRGATVWLTGPVRVGEVDPGRGRRAAPGRRRPARLPPRRRQPPDAGSTATSASAATGREENVRRVAEVACLFADAGRGGHGRADQPLCRRPPPGPRAARGGRDRPSSRSTWPPRSPSAPAGTRRASTPGPRPVPMASFTGVDDPYEVPTSPELVVSGYAPLEESVGRIVECLEHQGVGPAPHQPR